MQRAQKKAEEQETCATALAAGLKFLQRRKARQKSRNDGLKQSNKQLMQKALSAPQKEVEKIEKTFPYPPSDVLGNAIKSD